MYTELQFTSIIKDCFEEELRRDWADLSDDERDDWDVDSVAEGYDYSGRFHEIVDGCVPVYTHDVVTLWLDLNCPEAVDYGAEVDGADTIRQMMAGIYYWADEYARKYFAEWHERVVSNAATN